MVRRPHFGPGNIALNSFEPLPVTCAMAAPRVKELAIRDDFVWADQSSHKSIWTAGRFWHVHAAEHWS
jgi:hypothetical protein